MRTLLLASAAMLLSGSFALADNPLIPNDNDHMAALGFIIEHNAAVWMGRPAVTVVTSSFQGGAIMPRTALRVSPSFVRYEAENDHK